MKFIIILLSLATAVFSQQVTVFKAAGQTTENYFTATNHYAGNSQYAGAISYGVGTTFAFDTGVANLFKTAAGLNNLEPSLGNPATNGYVLSSTTDGTRSWIAAASGSGNLTSGPVTSSGGVSAIADNAIAQGKVNGLLTSLSTLNTAVTVLDTGKQATLVGSGGGQNIKTINGSTVLGSGDLTVSGGTWGGITGTLSSQADLTTALSPSELLPWTNAELSGNRGAGKNFVLRVFSMGDSWLSSTNLQDPLVGQFGWHGEIVQASSAALSAPILSGQHTKYSVGNYSGESAVMSASGHTVTWSKNGGRFNPANKFVFCYRQTSGAGTVQPQILDSAGTWINAGSAVSAAGSESTVWYEYDFVALTSFQALATQVRVVWVSGTTEIIAGGVTSSAANASTTDLRRGVVSYNAAYQGSNPGQWNTIPQQSWNSLMTYLKPQIVFIREYREVGTSTSTWLSNLSSVMTKMQTGRKSGTTATLAYGTGTSQVTLTAVASGIAGESVRCKFLRAGNSTALSVSVSGNDITVNLATDSGGVATSTAAQVVTAINASTPAAALVTASGSGSGTCGFMADFMPLSTGVGLDFVMIGAHPVSADIAQQVTDSDVALRDWCLTNRVLFVDTRAAFSSFNEAFKSGLISQDGLHLTNAGTKLVEKTVFQSLNLRETMQPTQFGSQPAQPQYYGGDGINGNWYSYYDGQFGAMPAIGFRRLDKGTVNPGNAWIVQPQPVDSSWISEGVKESIYGIVFRQVDNGGRQSMGYSSAMSRLIGGTLEIGTESGAKANLVLTGVSGQTAPILEVRSAGSSSAVGSVAATIKPDGQGLFTGCTLPPTTVAALPASPATNTFATVNNASAFTAGSTVAGGGSVKCLVQYDGAAWKMVLQLY